MLAIFSILAALLLIAISGNEFHDLIREFETSQSEQSAASAAQHKRYLANFTIRVGVLATEVCREDPKYPAENLFQVAAGSIMLLASIISSALTCKPLCCRPGRVALFLQIYLLNVTKSGRPVLM